MQNLIATTFEVVHYIALQAVHYKPLQEVHLSRYNQGILANCSYWKMGPIFVGSIHNIPSARVRVEVAKSGYYTNQFIKDSSPLIRKVVLNQIKG